MLRVSPGSFPFFLTGTKGRFSCSAIGTPKMKPSESTAAIASTSQQVSRMCSTRREMQSAKTEGFLVSEKISLQHKSTEVFLIHAIYRSILVGKALLSDT